MNFRKWVIAESIELNNSILTVYHRTGKSEYKAGDTQYQAAQQHKMTGESIPKAILANGFMPIDKSSSTSGSHAWGTGIYTYFNLLTALNRGESKYGPFVMKINVDISDFLVFDEYLANKLYPQNPYPTQQLEKRGISLEKIIRPGEHPERVQHIKQNWNILSQDFNYWAFRFLYDQCQPVHDTVKNSNGIIIRDDDGPTCVIKNDQKAKPVAYANAPQGTPPERIAWITKNSNVQAQPVQPQQQSQQSQQSSPQQPQAGLKVGDKVRLKYTPGITGTVTNIKGEFVYVNRDGFSAVWSGSANQLEKV